MNKNVATYWYAFHKLKFSVKRQNEIVLNLIRQGLGINYLFESDLEDIRVKLFLTNEELETIKSIKQHLPNIAFLTEDILNQGFNILSILDNNYPEKFREKLKNNAPTVLFVKGNLDVLKKDSISIVGARYSNDISLEFTKNISRITAETNRTIVSGGAKGVDSIGLINAIHYGGTCVVVLAEGVKQYKGYRDYYQALTEGRILFISSFDPDDRWITFKAQERNPLIYALGDKVFIAEAGEKGGTMNGAIYALKEHWDVHIRYPNIDETNANMALINKGCIPVDMNGRKIVTNLPKSELAIEKDIITNIERILSGRSLTIRELLHELKLNWKGTKLSGLIKRQESIISNGGKPVKYTLKGKEDSTFVQTELF